MDVRIETYIRRWYMYSNIVSRQTVDVMLKYLDQWVARRYWNIIGGCLVKILFYSGELFVSIRVEWLSLDTVGRCSPLDCITEREEHTQRERERERERWQSQRWMTVSCSVVIVHVGVNADARLCVCSTFSDVRPLIVWNPDTLPMTPKPWKSLLPGMTGIYVCVCVCVCVCVYIRI